MLRSLRGVAAVSGGAITMIAGAPGIGKSKTLQAFKDQFGRRTFMVQAVSGAGGVWGVAQALTAALDMGAPNGRGRDNIDAFEWLRFAAEEGCFSLVFAGDRHLVNVMAELPQLRSRLRRPVVIRRAATADVRAFAAALGLADGQMHDALTGVALAHGCLRDVGNVIEHARLFAGAERVELAHVLAAIEDLKLGPKGRGA
jgi:hypothetical protein